MKRIYLTLLISIFVLTNQAYAQRDFSKTVINTIPVSENIYMLEGEGGNIALCVGEDGVVMIDDQFAEINDKIMAAIKKLSSHNVKFVLNTHWHGDHTGGNELMHEAGANIIAHKNVRKRLSTKQVRKLVDRTSEARPKEALPILTFDENITLHFNNETIDLIHFGPGHTDGDTVVFFNESNVVHTGDLMFRGRFPYVDLDSGGSVDGYMTNVKTIIERINDDTAVIPGHGELATRKDLIEFHEMMETFVKRVKQAIKDGKSQEDVESMEIEVKYKEWGSGFISKERWLKTLYLFYSK